MTARGTNPFVGSANTSASSADSAEVLEEFVAQSASGPSQNDPGALRVQKGIRAPSPGEMRTADNSLISGHHRPPSYNHADNYSYTDSERTDSFGRLASRQFFEEMGASGILAVEKIADSSAIRPSAESKSRSRTAHSLPAESVSPAAHDADNNAAAPSPSPPPPTPPPPPPPPAPPALAAQVDVKGASNTEKYAANYFKPRTVPTSLPPQQFAQKSTNRAASSVKPFPFPFPGAYASEPRRAIPVTRLLEEEGRNIVAEEAIMWRSRCEEIERAVAELTKQLSAAPGVIPAAAKSSEKPGAWRAARNTFGRLGVRNTVPSTVLKVPSVDHAPTTNNSTTNLNVSNCDNSISPAPRSISPQQPDHAQYTPSPDGADPGESNIHAPALRSNMGPGNFVFHPAPGVLQPRSSGNTSASSTPPNHDIRGEEDDDRDNLTFDESPDAVSLSKSDADNLPLIIAKRQAQYLGTHLQRAQENVASLQADLARVRLRRDELETQAMTLEEQFYAQKDQMEQRIRDLESRLATQRDIAATEPLSVEAQQIVALLLPLLDEFPGAENIPSVQRRKIVEVINIARQLPDTFTGPDASPPTPILEACEKMKILVERIAAVADPARDSAALHDEISSAPSLAAMVAVAVKYTELAQELADTRAMHVAEQREELEVVRRDRNELLGQQGEQVRRLQAEILDGERTCLLLTERAETVQGRVDALSRETEELQEKLEYAAVGQVDDDDAASAALEQRLRGEFAAEKRALDAKHHQALASAEAAHRAQHKVFTERMTAAQEQLRSVRIVTDEERGKFASETEFLTRELHAARAALEAKEVALAIALREDVRQSMLPRRAASHPVFDHIKLAESAQRGHSSQGVTEGERTATAATTGGSVPSMAPLSHSQSPEERLPSNGDSAAARRTSPSPSPIAAAEAGNTPPVQSRQPRGPPAGLMALLLGGEGGASLAPAEAAAAAPRMPSRPAPSIDRGRSGSGGPTAASSSSTVAPLPAAPDTGRRRVTFAGVPPLTPPSPDPSYHHTAPSGNGGGTSPMPMSFLDASGWSREPSRSLSPPFDDTAFIASDTSGGSNDKENAPHNRHGRGGSSSGGGDTTTAASAAPLRQRLGSETNVAARRRFVKMGPLEGVREVWARQESLLLGGSPAQFAREEE